jgi:ABC-type bacteriocin/lantibiotic exporter with double-glycine peptidase domain
MQRGDAFPPIAVVRFGTRYYVADGHKRLSACRSLTSGPIVVEVWTRRRWLRDQWEQFSRKTRQQLDLARSFSSDADARRAARRLAIDTLEHWRRIARSLRQRSTTGSAAVSPLQLFMRLMRECLAFPGRLAGAVVSLVVLSAAQLYLTWLVKQWADGPLVGNGGDPVGLMIAGVAVTAIMVGAVFASRYLLNSVNQRMVQRLRDAALARILALRPAAAQEWRSGELVSRIVNDAGVLSAFVRDVLKRLLGEGLLVVGALTMAFYLDWRLALAVCTVVPVIILLLGRLGQIIRQRGAEAQAEIGGLSALLNEQLSGLSTIKGFESEAFEHARFADQNRRYRRSVMRGEWWASLLVTGVWMITGVGMWAVLWYGTRQVASGQITPGGLFAFFLYVLQTLEPLRRLSEVHALLQRALASAARVYEITDCTAIERGGTAAPHATRGSIRFEAVHFRYRPDEPVLQGLTLTVQPGEPIALVAASGGGKGTIQAPGALCRSAIGQHSARRHRHPHADYRSAATLDLRRRAGTVSLQRPAARQPALWQLGCVAPLRRGGGGHGRARGSGRWAAARPRHRDGRGRPQSVGRPEATHCAGACGHPCGTRRRPR